MQQDPRGDSARYFGIYRKYRANEVTYRTAVLWDQAGWHWRAYEGVWGAPFASSFRVDASAPTESEIQKELGKLVAQGGPFSDPGDAERDSINWIHRNVAGVVDVYREIYSWAQA
jgi:hypothetical protein